MIRKLGADPDFANETHATLFVFTLLPPFVSDSLYIQSTSVYVYIAIYTHTQTPGAVQHMFQAVYRSSWMTERVHDHDLKRL